MDFGSNSSAEEVLSGHHLRGKRVLITGVSSGVGAETARILTAHGATVIGTVRDMAKGAAVTEATRAAGDLTLIELDLSSLANVRTCARALLATGAPFDVVIANAGVMAVPFARTVDGFEMQFATNYLGHFLLVNHLAPLFRKGSRVVMVSSAGHRGADIDLDDLNFDRTPYDPLLAYRRSKTAMILFAARFGHHRDQGLRATAVHPGAVLTETTRKLIEAHPSAASTFEWKTVAQGAATSVWAGFVASADEIDGHYCEDCHVAKVDDEPAIGFGVRSYALDPARAEALWRRSVSLIGEQFRRSRARMFPE